MLGILGFRTVCVLSVACGKVLILSFVEREALRWVQKYVGAFGGDPTKVTMCVLLIRSFCWFIDHVALVGARALVPSLSHSICSPMGAITRVSSVVVSWYAEFMLLGEGKFTDVEIVGVRLSHPSRRHL